MTELRLAVRSLRRQPAMSALAVIALALGIGLTTTMFSIVNGVILRGLPFPESGRIAHVAPFSLAEQDDRPASVDTFADLRDRQQSFERFAAFELQIANVVGPDGVPARYSGAAVTANMFRLLRASPAAGRDFRDEDSLPGAEAVVIIGDRVWQEQYGRSPDAIGQALRVNGTMMTVAGVMPPGFRFPFTQDLWPALVVDPLGTPAGEGPHLEPVGRLRPGVSMEHAGAEMAALWRQHELAYPDRYPPGDTVEVKPYVEEFVGSELSSFLYTMLAAVFGVLIVGCANVANLVLARAAARTREVAVRTAIGASRWQVTRPMLTEVLMLAACGAVAGLALAMVGMTLFNRAIVDTNPPFWIDVRADWTVLAFVVGIALVAAVASGTLPAIRASRSDVKEVLGDEGRTTGIRMGRFSRALVIGEIGVSFGLLVAAGLVTQSLLNLSDADLGFATRDVWRARVALPAADYPDAERQRQFAAAILERLRTLPGVTEAALGSGLPTGGPRWSLRPPGQTYRSETDHPEAHGVVVSPGYFDVLRVTMVAGRAFDQKDREDGVPVAIVNQALANRLYPEGAIGEGVALDPPRPQDAREIVGVVPNLGMGDRPGDSLADAIYVPLAQVPQSMLTMLVHVSGPPLDVSGPARDAVRDLDANLPIFDVDVVQSALDQGAWPFRVFGSLFLAFGLAALFLASVGLYGVMAFSVRRRTREIGIRMALGASSYTVLGSVVAQGLWRIGLGIALGAGLGAVLGSGMRLLLFRVRPYDPWVFTAVGLVLALTGTVACFVPARRAARVDPMVALRYE